MWETAYWNAGYWTGIYWGPGGSASLPGGEYWASACWTGNYWAVAYWGPGDSASLPAGGEYWASAYWTPNAWSDTYWGSIHAAPSIFTAPDPDLAAVLAVPAGAAALEIDPDAAGLLFF